MIANRTVLERISDCEILITRAFAVPARIVFDAWTKPEYIKRWWGPASRGVAVVECEVDLRPGGVYRYVLQAGSDRRFAFSGEYSEVVRATRLVYTNRFEPVVGKPMPGEAIVTVTFDEASGVTRLSARERYSSKNVLDGVLASGMEAGMRETYEQLDALVLSLSSGSAL